MSEPVNFERFDTNLGIVYSNLASEQLGKDYWVVKRDFIYRLDGTGMSTVKVPRGYLTDGATVPRAFWSLVPPWGKYGQACVLHDYLCEYPFYDDGNTRRVIVRKEVDQIFNEAMQIIGVPTGTRRMMISAVNAYRVVSRTRDSTHDSKKAVLENQLRGHYMLNREWL